MKAGRTVWTVIWLSLVMLVALVLCGRMGETGPGMFMSACVFLGTLGGFQASKSAVEAVASGSGLKGMKAALMTDTGTPSSSAASTVHLPSPESDTRPANPARLDPSAKALAVRSRSHEAITLPRRQTSAMSARLKLYW